MPRSTDPDDARTAAALAIPLPRTPLVRVTVPSLPATVWCKLELLHPSGSTKDRIAAFIILKALRSGRVRPGSRVVEASSGSTSIAMAMVCAQLGLRFVAVMPRGVSGERRQMIEAFGGEVHTAPKGADMAACIGIAAELAEQRDGFFPRQFENEDNADAHRHGTAREILEQLPRQVVDAVVAGMGTGGTLVGLDRGLRDAGCDPTPFVARPVELTRPHGPLPCCEEGECFCDVEASSFSSRIAGVVESMSQLYTAEEYGRFELIDVEDTHALEATRTLHRMGFPVGPSSGLNMAAALRVARRLPPDATIVTVFPDRMERYFSTSLFAR